MGWNNGLFRVASFRRITSASSEAIETSFSTGMSPASCRPIKRIAQTLRNDVKLLRSWPASMDSLYRRFIISGIVNESLSAISSRTFQKWNSSLMLVTMPCILIERAEVSQSFVFASINNLHITVIFLPNVG